MTSDEKQFLLTAVWLFMRHGQGARARNVCEAVLEDEPRNGAAAAAMAELLLENGEARRALEVLLAADFPPDLEHAEAVLETRALRQLGRSAEGNARWKRYLESKKGPDRKWV